MDYTGNDKTTNISNEWTTENNNTKDDGEKKPPRGQEIAREKEATVGEENPKMEEMIHTRRSERVRRQRYNIHPDDIGNDDDKSDQDYVLEG